MRNPLFLTCLGLLLTFNTASADPYTLRFTSTVISDPAPKGVTLGDPLIINIVVDNGGSDQVSETWDAGDILSVNFAAGPRYAINIVSPTLNGTSGTIQTDDAGNVSAVSAKWFVTSPTALIDSNGTAVSSWGIDNIGDVAQTDGVLLKPKHRTGVVANWIALPVPNAGLAPIKMVLEEPVNGGVSNGIANLRGWVVGASPIQRVAFYLDGVYKFDIPAGGDRSGEGDVGDVFPDYPGSDKSGFSMAYGYSNLTAGSHTAKVIAYDSLGNTAEDSSTFTVVRFDNAYIPSFNDVDLTAASCAFQPAGSDPAISDLFTVNGGVFEGQTYDLQFGFNPATQQLDAVNINKR